MIELHYTVPCTELPLKKDKKPKRRKSISLTEQAIKQIELMLIAVYREKRKPLPETEKLRKMAERFHRKHFE